jgi:putative Mn2+ efflux pump MntP
LKLKKEKKKKRKRNYSPIAWLSLAVYIYILYLSFESSFLIFSTVLPLIFIFLKTAVYENDKDFSFLF